MIVRPGEEIKSYEEVIGEAVAKLPLLSGEWTNYNVSDPGITILQNFSAFHVIQESSIREITEQVRRNLLKLMGFTAGVSRPARAFLIPEPGTGTLELPAHQRIMAGGTCFETVKEESIGQEGLAGVWLEERGELREVTYLLKSETIGAVPAFCTGPEGEPSPGNGIWLVFDRIPGPGDHLALYFAVDEGKRNPFDLEHVPEFAKISWQCFTEEGWERVEIADETACFLTGGCVIFTVPAKGAKRFQNGRIDGYVIRCRLLKSSYDCPPVIRTVYDHVIEVEQRKTLAAMFCFSGGRMEIPSALARDGALEVYVQEREHGDYRRYEHGDGGKNGRYYRMSVDHKGNSVLEIVKKNGKSSGADGEYGPWGGERSVIVVCRAKDALPYRNLGTVYGYDDQIIEVEHTEHIIQEGFCVTAKMRNRDGEEVYRFAVPGMKGEEELGYELLSREGRLRIFHPGYRSECQLYLASCSVVKDGFCSLRQGSRLRAEGAGFGEPFLESRGIGSSRNAGTVCFTSISTAGDGAACESIEELERRFTMELRQPQTAVTAADYEILTRQTPGLCIDQVKAWMNERENRVVIAVKPFGGGRFPELSKLYRTVIRGYLEPRRMAATRMTLTGPAYVPISLRGRIRGNKRFADCQGIVKRFLERRFEEMAYQAGFGGAIPFHLLFRELENLDCVAEVCDLEAEPRKPGARMYGGEILLENHCLGYPGDIRLEIIF